MQKTLENKLVRVVLVLLLLVAIIYSFRILITGLSGEGAFVENITSKEYQLSFEIYKAERQSDVDKVIQSEFYPEDPILIVIYNDTAEDVEVVYIFSSANNEIQRITIPIPAEDSRTISAPSDLAFGEYRIQALVDEEEIASTSISIISSSNQVP